ncbi:MAG TPA: D-aminoacylase [Steroidobacteraceae bacterium]|jgi:N-acyl-D-amino-acid deacylase|nr:D-aminoacylase [Steroidobacteraceae bacterium]
MRTLYVLFMALAAVSTAGSAAAANVQADHDTIIRGGTIYDGSGKAGYVGDVAIDGDRISYAGPHAPGKGRLEIDARGKAVAPGFVNMLAHPEESLLVDKRALSDLKQGVTLEVMGEDSMGPLNPKMKQDMLSHQGDIHYPVDWTTLGEYLDKLQAKGIAPNVASFVGAGTIRTYVLGEDNVEPTAAQLRQMRDLVHQAMEQGALGVTTALIYNPNTYAKTSELIALAQESGLCGGMYIAHMRSEGDRITEAVQETIDIAKGSGAPAEIYHLKVAGRVNWPKIDSVIKQVEDARASGTRISADMYVYTAGATGLDVSMPAWVQEGGLDKWIARLKDPAIRARVLADMRDPNPTWENLLQRAGPKGALLLEFKNPALKPLTGKTLDEVAKMRGMSPEETAMQLVVEDGSRVGTAYFLMSEENVSREVALPWVSFGSDAGAPAPEGVFLESSEHPRAYGNFVRVLAKYVRDDKVVPMEAAIRKLSAMPAQNLSLKDRGELRKGYFADVVVFDPKTIQDHSTYDRPHQLATGVEQVWINGVRALRDGDATGLPSGRFVHGRAWTRAPGGGCKAAAGQWTWSK